MRHGLIGLLLLGLLIVGCAKKEETKGGEPLKDSKDIETKNNRGKMVEDVLPKVPTK